MDPLKVLIIEDDLIEAADMQESLESEGRFVTTIASNTQEVKRALKQQIPDLALVDIRLEGSMHNGIEIVEELLSVHSLPIVYLTSSTEKPYVEAARRTQPAAFMFKPFRSNELAIQLELAYLNRGIQPDFLASESLFLPTDQGRGHVRIMKKEVVYMLAGGSYVEVYIRKGTSIVKTTFSMNLGHLDQYFPSYQFYRISRSLIVNLDFVERVERNCLFMTAVSKPIPYPESKHRDLLQKLAVVRTP
ncbi:response regulator transcription factor [Persicitalea jodogahamensis]|uniref:Response regulatory domain-containing protein n=1 Tax=Persicitalea jodogahamensis TaxID=402147 RepID=A0A8J3D3B9_9BACT|nr:response regulator transcription factor [Persicitalea jodogahamensis]GHB66965.1 hypothetical protein GCM10007390_20320 [Persicitalea jodogahamensis]